LCAARSPLFHVCFSRQFEVYEMTSHRVYTKNVIEGEKMDQRRSISFISFSLSS
jgi:hypothetical protein